jgi:prepilin-type N-terminal cleavage/methylation domain-containing protein/prepilin-type processing-associated H-X9-DG protein
MTKSSPHLVKRGFTLIELLVVMAGIGILLGIAVPAFHRAFERARATKDLNNLRQIGVATQLYMNDNNGALFSTTGSWMSQLYNADNPAASKYISSWNVFVSPFDHPVSPRTALSKSATSAVSYGINGTAGVVGMSADKISSPTAFIVFAPAQASGITVTFQGVGDTTSQAALAASSNVTVQATNSPGGPATGGTQSDRVKINALFADWHVETMYWSAKDPAFINMAATGTDPDGAYRWSP